MTIFTSDRPNDADMNQALGSLACPMPNFATGDACFTTTPSSVTGVPSLVCIERKKLGDLISCIESGRYLHQLQIAAASGADIFVLIAELGEIRSAPEDGLIEHQIWRHDPITHRRSHIWVPSIPQMTYSRLSQYLFELSYIAGVHVIRTADVNETAAVIKALYVFFQKPDNQHQSLKQIFKPAIPTVSFVKPSLVRRVASELKGVGWERSKAIDERFSSVLELVNADAETLSSVDGIGKKLAVHITSEPGWVRPKR